MKRVFLSLLTILSLAPVAAGAEERKEFRPAKYQKDGWTTRCWAGEDGFAVNCEAAKRAAPYLLRMSVGHDQLFLQIEHSGCETHYRYHWRDEVSALPEKERREQAINDFDLLTLDLKKQCPNLPPVPRTFLHPPDITLVGKEVLR